nr:lipocalin family protein [Allomuricauda sp.]|tara:strand:+ start:891 stop:1322 length:432 start_codon:yes stop_codon:yes gene_type:complete
MKKVLFLLLLGALFASCSNDDDAGNNISSEKLIATWIPTTITVDGETFPYDDHEDCGFDTIRFQNNGQGTITDVFECEEVTTTFTYTLSNEILEITSSGVTLEATIIELSTETLILQSEWDYDDDGDTEIVIEAYESGVTISE